ncbi:MAG: FtsQ-type POTRA domain-containing protein [Actinobacteria bacterium]|nr:FtsQ-type POTRA domain-containing protein [Actinomycetota bacterium]
MTSTTRSPDGRVVVPERLRRRRIEIQRGRGRRRLRRLVAFGGLALVAGLAWAALQSPLFAVRHVEVHGSAHVDARQVAAAGIAPGVAMIDVVPGRASHRIESLPWVAHATVKREWPGRVLVEIVDREPVAQVAAGSRFATVDDTGRVLETGVARMATLPLLANRSAAAPGLRIASAGPLLDTAAALPDRYRGKVASVGFTRDGSVALQLDDDAVVTVGQVGDFGAKFASLDAVLAHVGTLHGGCTLDVSVPTAPTLTPEYGCA